LAEMLKVMNLR